MEIPSISNYDASRFSAQTQRDSAKTDSFADVLDRAVQNNDVRELRSACVEFESYFIHFMMREMRKTLKSDEGILPKSSAENIFQDMLDEEWSKNAANAGGIGLSDMMYNQLSKTLMDV
ncbi:MAG: rod-binding protein [Clostridiales bacterium]|jgi:flagellar protein FlgJ|nr:rod-binding protein [Clostridiales bacterium]